MPETSVPVLTITCAKCDRPRICNPACPAPCRYCLRLEMGALVREWLTIALGHRNKPAAGEFMRSSCDLCIDDAKEFVFGVASEIGDNPTDAVLVQYGADHVSALGRLRRSIAYSMGITHRDYSAIMEQTEQLAGRICLVRLSPEFETNPPGWNSLGTAHD